MLLEATNLKLPTHLTPKLSPRRYGPFRVAAIISPVAYKLDLPNKWNIHNVFHASLLTPYKETEQHGENFVQPPPDIIDGEPEWEVDAIMVSRRYGRKKTLQYLIRWKGYSPAHDQWIDAKDVHAPELIKTFHDHHPAAIKATIIDEQVPHPHFSPSNKQMSSNNDHSLCGPGNIAYSPSPSPNSPPQGSPPLPLNL